MLSLFDEYKNELGKPRYNAITDRKVEHQLLLNILENPKDLDSFHKLTYSNMRFVVYVLKEFTIPPAVSIMDIIQDGNIGLMVGIRRFDPVKFPDTKLFSYVVWWIRFFIRAALEDNKEYVNHKAPGHLDTINDALDDMAENDFDTPELNFKHAFTDAGSQVALADINLYLNEILNKREIAVIRLYFGIGNDGIPRTLEAIGRQLYIKFVRVRQIRDQAIEKLRDSMKDNSFFSYF